MTKKSCQCKSFIPIICLVLFVSMIIFFFVRTHKKTFESYRMNEYNDMKEYDTNSFFFRVSPKRQEALDEQVQMCHNVPYKDPIEMANSCENRYNCNSYLSRGGYDACSNCNKKSCGSHQVAGI